MAAAGRKERLGGKNGGSDLAGMAGQIERLATGVADDEILGLGAVGQHHGKAEAGGAVQGNLSGEGVAVAGERDKAQRGKRGRDGQVMEFEADGSPEFGGPKGVAGSGASAREARPAEHVRVGVRI